MSLAESILPVEGSVPLGNIDRELSKLVNEVTDPGTGPVQRARMSNLMIYCNQPEQVSNLSAAVPAIVTMHPCRVLLLVADVHAQTAPITAFVDAWCEKRGSLKVCSEQVLLHAKGGAVERLPYVVRGLLIGDLPTNIWWASQTPPPMAGPLLYELAEPAQQIIYDSIGWLEPPRGVDAVATWLERFERGSGLGWRVASDLNWRRLKFWRRLMGQSLSPASAPGALESITEVQVEHGPHAVVQAWELVSWLASRLHWQVQTGRVQPGVEIAWQVAAPHGSLRIRIRRLSEGPSEVRRVRIACTLDGKPSALNFAPEEAHRLAVTIEGTDKPARTLTVQTAPLAGLVGRQLSDRDHDPVFRESMAVAQVLARSVLG